MTQHHNSKGVEEHCQSCHEDHSDYGFPYDESWDYGDNLETEPPPDKQYCCCDQRRIGDELALEQKTEGK